MRIIPASNSIYVTIMKFKTSFMYKLKFKIGRTEFKYVCEKWHHCNSNVGNKTKKCYVFYGLWVILTPHTDKSKSVFHVRICNSFSKIGFGY